MPGATRGPAWLTSRTYFRIGGSIRSRPADRVRDGSCSVTHAMTREAHDASRALDVSAPGSYIWPAA